MDDEPKGTARGLPSLMQLPARHGEAEVIALVTAPASAPQASARWYFEGKSAAIERRSLHDPRSHSRLRVLVRGVAGAISVLSALFWLRPAPASREGRASGEPPSGMADRQQQGPGALPVQPVSRPPRIEAGARLPLPKPPRK